jgi:uncharacterized protein YabE (DUF348 family)
VKYGLNAAVLAGLVGGIVAWTNVDKTVTLVVDGQSTRIHTTAATVDGVLADAGYTADSHDLLAPAAGDRIQNGGRVVLKRGRLLNLNIDGVQRSVWTTAPTVAAAMNELGYSAEDFTSVSRSRRLPLSPTDISVRTPKFVTVVHDGTTQHVTTTDVTVSQLLADLRVTVGPQDSLSMAEGSPLQQDARIVLKRVKRGHVTVSKSIPFTTRSTHDPQMLAGQTRLVRPGRDGLARITYAVVYIDGREVGRTKIHTVVVRVPKRRLVKIGTKERAALATRGATLASSGGSPKDIARQLVAARGWSSGQFDCLVTLWDHESGWNVHAANASGAYGIPQAVPGDKMASAGPDWQDNALTQIKWGLGYVAERYGTPCGAWSFWQNNGWY